MRYGARGALPPPSQKTIEKRFFLCICEFVKRTRIGYICYRMVEFPRGVRVFRYLLAFGLIVFFYTSPLHSASKKRAAASAAEEAVFAARPVIRSIDVKVNELFPGKSGFAKRAANALHAATRKSVIIRELLYRPGQRLDKRLILESEKNLTAYLGFYVVKTHLKPVKGADTVDVVVEIQDIWSIYTNVKLEGGGGDLEFNLTMGDKNFLGRNQSLEFSFDKSRFHTHWKQSFKEPFFFGSRLRFEERTALYYDRDGRQVGEGVGLSLIYPLFSRASKWGFQLYLDYDRNREYSVTGSSIDTVAWAPFYEKKYQKEKLELTCLVTRSFGYDVKHYLSAGFTLDRTGHTPIEDIASGDMDAFSSEVLPQDKKRNYLKAGYTLDTSRYIRVRNFFYLGRLETYAIGFRLETMVGFSRKSWWSDADSYLLSSYLRYSAFFAKNHILSFQLSGSSELFTDGSQLNGIFSAKLYYYIRDLPLGFFALRVQADLGENLDVDNVFTMGSSTGLRGYPNDILEGNRRIFVNVEYRFDAIKIGVTRLGFLLFFDVGTAWVNQKEKQTANEHGLVPGTMYPAAGLGLRLTIPSINPNVFRFDFGYNFGNGDTEFENMFSFGYNHVF